MRRGFSDGGRCAIVRGNRRKDSVLSSEPTELPDGVEPEIGVSGKEGCVPRPLRLSEEIAGLLGVFAERSVTLREVMEVLRGRAYTLLLILLVLPFCTPIPLPGISTPFGLVVAVIGFRLALGQKPWLPARLLDTQLPASIFRGSWRGHGGWCGGWSIF